MYCTDHQSQRSDDEDDEEEEGEVEEEEAAVKKGSDEEDSEQEAEQKEEKTDGSQVVFSPALQPRLALWTICSDDRVCQVDDLSAAERQSLLRNELRPAIKPFKGNKLFLRFATQGLSFFLFTLSN